MVFPAKQKYNHCKGFHPYMRKTQTIMPSGMEKSRVSKKMTNVRRVLSPNWATISKNDIVNRAPHLLVQDHTVLQIPLFCNGLEGAV